MAAFVDDPMEELEDNEVEEPPELVVMESEAPVKLEEGLVPSPDLVEDEELEDPS